MSRQAGSSQALRNSKSRGGSSKYDFIKVRVWLGEAPSAHYYVLSRYLICRMLTVTGVHNVKAAKVALQVKKYLVDHDQFDVTQTELENTLFDTMRQHGYDDSYVKRYRMVAAFYQSRTPLVLLLCGAPCVGKSTIARVLAERLNLPNVQQTSIISELLQDDDQDDENTLLFGSLGENNDTVEEEGLIQEFRTQCMKIRGGIQGDLTKAFKDRKSLIVEGLHLDPGLYLSEFGVEGIRDVSVPEKQKKQDNNNKNIKVESTTETPFGKHQRVPEFGQKLKRMQSSPIMIRSQTTPDFVRALSRQQQHNLQDAMFLLKKPSPDPRAPVPSPKLLRQLSRREAERSLRTAYISIRQSSSRRLLASTSLRAILASHHKNDVMQPTSSMPLSRKKSLSDGEQERVASALHSGVELQNLNSNDKTPSDLQNNIKADDVMRWITSGSNGDSNQQLQNSTMNDDNQHKVSQVQDDDDDLPPSIRIPNRTSQNLNQKQSPSARKSSFERNNVMPSRLRQTTFENEVIEVSNSMDKNNQQQLEDNNYLADADSSKSDQGDKDSNSGDEVVPTKQISIESKNLSQQIDDDDNNNKSYINGSKFNDMRPPKSKQLLKMNLNEVQKFEPEVKNNNNTQMNETLKKDTQKFIGGNYLQRNSPKRNKKEKINSTEISTQNVNENNTPKNSTNDVCAQDKIDDISNQNQSTQNNNNNNKNDNKNNKKNINQKLEQYPLFVPIVLSMPYNDHRALAEEWFLRQKEIQQQNLNSEPNSQQQNQNEFEKVFRKMRVLQEYLEAYKNHGVPVVRISIGHFRDTLDQLHEYLLQCIEMNVSRWGLPV